MNHDFVFIVKVFHAGKEYPNGIDVGTALLSWKLPYVNSLMNFINFSSAKIIMFTQILFLNLHSDLLVNLKKKMKQDKIFPAYCLLYHSNVTVKNPESMK